MFWLFASKLSSPLSLYRDLWWAVKEHRWTPAGHLSRLREAVITGPAIVSSHRRHTYSQTQQIGSVVCLTNEDSEVVHVSKALCSKLFWITSLFFRRRRKKTNMRLVPTVQGSTYCIDSTCRSYLSFFWAPRYQHCGVNPVSDRTADPALSKKQIHKYKDRLVHLWGTWWNPIENEWDENKKEKILDFSQSTTDSAYFLYLNVTDRTTNVTFRVFKL